MLRVYRIDTSRARELWNCYTVGVKRPPNPSAEPGVAVVASLIGDPARAAMLCALMDGGELAAGDLASRAGLAANAASVHLGKLVAGGLLNARASGRQRFFRLANDAVGSAVEALATIAPPTRVVALSQSRISVDLRVARTCYDHLAGRYGVAVTERLVRTNVLIVRGETFALAPRAEAMLDRLGVDIAVVRESRRVFVRGCLDWSERRPHLAGALGAAICDAFFERGFVIRRRENRSLIVTAAGKAWLG